MAKKTMEREEGRTQAAAKPSTQACAEGPSVTASKVAFRSNTRRRGSMRRKCSYFPDVIEAGGSKDGSCDRDIGRKQKKDGGQGKAQARPYLTLKYRVQALEALCYQPDTRHRQAVLSQRRSTRAPAPSQIRNNDNTRRAANGTWFQSLSRAASVGKRRETIRDEKGERESTGRRSGASDFGVDE